MRKARIIVDGATYHVIARTNRKEMLLDSAFSKDLFLQVLLQAKSHYHFEINNFVIMGNRFHLLLRPTNGSTLSEIMKWILAIERLILQQNRPHRHRRVHHGTPQKRFVQLLGVSSIDTLFHSDRGWTYTNPPFKAKVA